MRTQDTFTIDATDEVSVEQKFSYFPMDEEIAAGVPCSISGVNTAEGIKNTGGRVSKYVETLRLFCIESSNLADNMAGYYSRNGDMFRIKIHGLKNSCSCIGAEDHAERAKALERGLALGQDLATDLDEFIADIRTLVENIGAYVDAVRAACAGLLLEEKEVCHIPGVPREPAAQLREAMLNLELEDAMEKLADIRVKRYDRDIEIYLDRMLDHMNQYDFDEAIRILDKITERL